LARREHRWRRRTVGTLAVLVVAPLLGIAVLWPLTPGVGQAAQLVRAHLAASHSPELVALPRPDRVGQALIATEDSRFFQTPGIDPISAVHTTRSTTSRPGGCASGTS
jgi:penicillin-binding protein 1A